MKNIYRILLFFVVGGTVASCGDREEPAADSRATILVYMEARNNLSGDSESDMREMLLAEVPADCRLLVYQSTYGIAPRLLEVENGNTVTLKTWADGTSAVDPGQMADVIATARALAPAGEFGLVMWSHSSGWQQSPHKSRGFGLENSSAQMSVSNLALALEGQGLDYLIFDTCYMGCVEVAYELRRCAGYMVASVCEVPTNGMPYQHVLPLLFERGKGLSERLAASVDANVDWYMPGVTGCPSTMSVIDLSRMEALAAAFSAAAGELPAGFEPQRFSLSSPFQNLFFDFGQYFAARGGDESALAAAVVYERHTPMIWGRLPLTHCSGLSVFLPEFAPGYDRDSFGYSTLEWAKRVN